MATAFSAPVCGHQLCGQEWHGVTDQVRAAVDRVKHLHKLVKCDKLVRARQLLFPTGVEGRGARGEGWSGARDEECGTGAPQGGPPGLSAQHACPPDKALRKFASCPCHSLGHLPAHVPAESSTTASPFPPTGRKAASFLPTNPSLVINHPNMASLSKTPGEGV